MNTNDLEPHNQMEAEAAKQDLQSAKSLAKEAGTNLKSAATMGVDVLKDEASRRAQVLKHDAREKSLEYRDTLEGRIREEPIKAVAIALGIGAFLGLIMKK